jgi:dTDP-4-dehydrorhamnose 3,5-epimerase
MDIRPTAIAGVFEIGLDVHGDARGQFMRRFCARSFGEAGLQTQFVQINQSITIGAGTVRGMHFQRGSAAEVKLVGCTLGRAFDVAVDLRENSATFGHWVSTELNENTMLYIPRGCAHGFQALTETTHLLYLHDNFYAPALEGGVRYNDPALGIDWPLPPANLSARDLAFAPLGTNWESLSL